jgi:hypothetical protein
LVSGEEDILGLNITVDHGWAERVEVVETTARVERDRNTLLPAQGGLRHRQPLVKSSALHVFEDKALPGAVGGAGVEATQIRMFGTPEQVDFSRKLLRLPFIGIRGQHLDRARDTVDSGPVHRARPTITITDLE